jgi:predicted anti-sigma-YlaC factor YlaD
VIQDDEVACRELVELVTDYFEGALSEEDRRRFEDHLLQCDGCREYLEQMQTTVAALHRLCDEPTRPHKLENLFALFNDWSSQRDGPAGV